MKTLAASIAAAVGASACCLGPVVFAAAGAGALSAAAVRLEPLRPWFLGLTLVLLAAGFYSAYGPPASRACAGADGCPPARMRRQKLARWIVAAIVMLIAAFPYYVGWLI